MTANQIAYFKAMEEQRHNQAVEQETIRSNRNTERINRASQQATAQHYRVSDAESIRSHMANETISLGTLGLGYQQLGETKRHNVATEGIQSFTAASQAELNAATRDLRSAEAAFKAAETEYEKALTDKTTAQIEQVKAETLTEGFKQNESRARTSNLDIQSTYIPLHAFNETLSDVGNIVLGGLNYGSNAALGASKNQIANTRNQIELLKTLKQIQRTQTIK